jgi:hypothetical protein
VEEEIVGPLLADCAITDLDALARRCAHRRAALGHGTTRWQPACLVTALQLAVRVRGWPAPLAAEALLAIAADPATRSPMRLAEAGPWWDIAAEPPPADRRLVEACEARLADLDGQRVQLQAAARAELAAENAPLTRSTVAVRACQLLDRGPGLAPATREAFA